MWPFLSGLAGSVAIPAIDFITSNAVLSDRGIINTPKRNLNTRPEGSMSTLGGKPVQWMDNRWVPFQTEGEMARQEQAKIRAGLPTANELPTVNSSFTDTPIQRAEKQERSRISQLTEQDPLFKKYRVAELTKAYNTASPEDKEKIGLEIWATTNPELAQNLKPGQLGYTQATSAVMSQSPLGQFQAQTGDMQYANKMDQVPAAMAGFQPQTPLTGIPTPAAPQIGVSEAFAKSTPIPGATEMFTDPRKFLSQEELSQTQLALLKKAFESRLK